MIIKSHQIVFLDSSTVDLGDIDMSSLEKAGTYRSFKLSSQSQIGKRAESAQILITNKCVLDRKILSQLKNLQLICLAATGVNNVDLEAAREMSIGVCNVAGYSTDTVAEHALLFILACSHRLLEHHTASITHWPQSPHFAVLDFPFSEIKGKVLGIVGYGKIGKAVAKRARAFGMKVLIAQMPGRKYAPNPKRTPLPTLLAQSDFVSLHAPLAQSSFHLMDESRLNRMKPTAFLLNLARGALVDERAVARFLKQKKLGGYATDVLEEEPPRKNHPFCVGATHASPLHGKTLITPHIAWASREARQRLVNEMAANIEAFKAGKKRNRVV